MLTANSIIKREQLIEKELMDIFVVFFFRAARSFVYVVLMEGESATRKKRIAAAHFANVSERAYKISGCWCGP